MRFNRSTLLAVVTACAFWVTNVSLQATSTSDSLNEVKGYLVSNLDKMVAAGHQFVSDAAAYQAIIDNAHGDYDLAASTHGVELGKLVKAMQGDFGVYHNHGYETIEGIVAGTHAMVEFDNYLDGGVPLSEASTDSPASPLVLKTKDGTMISDRNGNLFHYVIEPTLWGTKPFFLKKLSPAAQQKLAQQYQDQLHVTAKLVALPRADVLTAASLDCARKLDELKEVANKWQPTLSDCIGAMVWMTPTLSGYFDDWRDSRFNPDATGKYVAESRVMDMRGIMYSLKITCDALLPLLEPKNPGLANQLKFEYGNIITFIDRAEQRDRQGGYKMSVPEIEEMAKQAKTITDQLDPQLHQMAALLDVRIPPKPSLGG